MREDRNCVTMPLFCWVIGGLAAVFLAMLFLTSQFHVDQRQGLEDRVERYDEQRQLVSVQLATLQGQVAVVLKNTEHIMKSLRSDQR